MNYLLVKSCNFINYWGLGCLGGPHFIMAASLKSMSDYWKTFNLPEVQKSLDLSAADLAARQDESEASRKRLVELSREFKRTTPEDVRKVVAPLLKSFQTEIDSLSKRSKNAEALFLMVYKKLVELPDPVPVLEHGQQLQKKAHRAQDLEIENQQLRGRLDEYNNEFAEVKNQEVTVKQLKEKVKELDEKLESTAQAKAKEREKELQRQFADKERQLQETQMVVARKLGESEHRVSTLQSALENVQSELFDMKSKYDEATSAKSDEMDIIMADLDRANERSAAYERQVEQLRQQLSEVVQGHVMESRTQEPSPDMQQAIDILKRSSLEVELAAKEGEVAQLVEDNRRLQATIGKLRDTTSSQTARLEEELSSKTRSVEILQEKLAGQTDYDEIKRELGVMKSLEFSNMTVDSSSAQTSSSSADQAKTLETLLLEKNRALQTENTQLKVANNDVNGRYSKLQQQYNEAFTSIQDQKQLIAQLEEDLRSVNAWSAMFRGTAEGAPVSTASTPSVEFVKNVVDEVAQPPVDASLVRTAADSLLPIVQSQRERFRVRAQELETQVVVLQQQMQLQQNETDKLRSDNVKLYEKIKFLQGYSANKGTVSSTDETVVRYSTQYDQKLDPFTSFSKRERLRKYMDLRPYDKITLGMGRFIMGNKLARTIVFFYTIILHVLVFLVLYKLAYTSSCKRDMAAEDWHKKFAEHMLMVHGSDDTADVHHATGSH